MKKIWKLLTVLTLAACFALGTVACGEDGAGRGKTKKISFLHIWPEHSAQMTKIVNDFMAENEDIEIEILQSSYEDIGTFLNTQVFSSSLPDVFFYWTNQVAGYAKNDYLLDLTPYLEGWKDGYINDGEAWDLAKFDGKYYSAPFRVTGNIIVYNKTLFENAGITEKDLPQDLQGFETLLSRLRAYSAVDSFAPLCVTGTTTGNMAQLYTAFQSFATLQQETYLDPNYRKGILAMDDAAFTLEGRMIDKLRDWNNKKYFGNAEGKSDATAVQNFVQGNAAMVLMNNNNLYLLDDMEDTEIGFLAIPAPTGLDYTYIYSDFDGFSISKSTRSPEAAVRFLKYLTSNEVQQRFAEETGSIMTSSSVTYADPDQAGMAEVMKDAGNAELAQTELAYSTSNIADENIDFILDYIFGKSSAKANGKEVSKAIYNNYVIAMRDAGLTPQAYTVTPKPADFSWLDIR